MFSTYRLKPRFQDMLRPAVRFLAGRCVRPNHVTIAALLLSYVAGALLLLFQDEHRILLILPPMLFARMALNAIDGMLAREHAMTTHAGAILNELGDVAGDAVFYLPLAMVPGISGHAIVAFVLLAAQVEMAGVVVARAAGRRSFAGPMGKSDRALAVGVLGFALGSGMAPVAWSTPYVCLLDLLLVLTLVNRVRDGLRSG